MGRSPRLHIPGTIHHVMSRGNGGEPIVADDKDLGRILDVVARVKSTSDFRLYAYCLMSNHAHFLIEVGSVSLSRIMQRIETIWSKRFNFEHHRSGHVFQGRFKSICCGKDRYFMGLLRYIHLNPVRAGLIGRPEDWAWSSYREYLNLSTSRLTDTTWPLSLFSDGYESEIDSFRRFVLQGLQEEPQETIPLSDGRTPPILQQRPSDGFILRPALETILTEAGRDTGVERSAILSSCRRQVVSLTRRLVATRASAVGYGNSEIARTLGLSAPAVSRMLNHLPPFAPDWRDQPALTAPDPARSQ